MPTLSHKIRLDPTEAQIVQFRKACGCARFAWNWALARWNEKYAAGEKCSGRSLDKEFNAIKGELYPWTYESPKNASAQPFRNLHAAFQRFFKKTAKYPKFKSKGKNHDSFYVQNDRLRINNKTCKLPLIGEVRMREELRLSGKIMSGVVSRTADQWYLSVTVEIDELPRTVKKTDKVVGIDLGLKETVVTNDGDIFKAPKPLKKYGKLLSRRSRQHSRKVKGSNNKYKSQMKLAKLHAKIANIRKDFTHKATSKLIDENQVIGLEDLNVAGMMKNHCLAKAISDVSWYEIRRQLEYKAKLYGREVRLAGRFFPSSKTCSKCGSVKKKLELSERVFKCGDCGYTIDRDLNAAINIQHTVGHTGINAWGESVPLDNSLNQEVQ